MILSGPLSLRQSIRFHSSPHPTISTLDYGNLVEIFEDLQQIRLSFVTCPPVICPSVVSSRAPSTISLSLVSALDTTFPAVFFLQTVFSEIWDVAYFSRNELKRQRLPRPKHLCCTCTWELPLVARPFFCIFTDVDDVFVVQDQLLMVLVKTTSSPTSGDFDKGLQK